MKLTDLQTNLLELNFKFGEESINDIVKKNNSLASVSRLIGSIIENTDESYQEKMNQNVNNFYEKNSIIETSLDKVFTKITKIDEKVELKT